MKPHFYSFFLLLLLFCSPLRAQEVEAASFSPLQARIDTLLARHLPQGSEVGIAAYDLTDRRPLYAYRADRLSRPASNMKLLTAITALDRPEADEPFRTEVWYTGQVKNDTLHGDLYVVGGYDPEFDEAALDSLAAVISRLPFSVIEGELCGDVSLKDSLYWGAGWSWDDNPYSYQPYLSPLMLCKGLVTVTVTPGEQGDTARVSCRPASTYYKVENDTRSRTASAGRFRLTRRWIEDDNTLLLSGNVERRQSSSLNVRSSQDFFMHVLSERLYRRGLRTVSGIIARSNGPGKAVAPIPYVFRRFCRDSTAVLVTAYETPVQTVLDQIMKESDNLNAEAMLCRLGAQFTGRRHISAEDGLSAIRLLIKEKLGLDPDRYALADGCGLSSYNYLSPELLVAFLRYAYSQTDLFCKLYKALPVGGVDGTLKNRMKRGTPSYRNVHAKTGSFTGINTLSGYLRDDRGHLIAFSIMNQNVLSGREARAFQDRVCDALIRGK